MSVRSIPSLLEQQVKYAADDIAIMAPGGVALSYGNLWSHITQFSRHFSSAGIARDDCIAVVIHSGPEMAVAFLGVTSCATCASLNPAYTKAEFDFYLADLCAKAVVVQEGVDLPVRSIAAARGIPIVELTTRAGKKADEFLLSGWNSKHEGGGRELSSPDDVALLLHTSGTTSRPKMVPLTHANLCSSARNVCAAAGLTSSDRCLNVMPLFHIHGLIGALLSSLWAGANAVCSPGFLAPKFFAWMDEFRPTWYTAVPTMHQAILDRAGANQKVIESCPLRLIRSSSAALPPQVMSELERVFHAPVIESYGMTEASHQMASNPLPPLTRKKGSVGIPAGPEIAIMDDHGTLLDSGMTGEIVIRGENVMDGYRNPDANATAVTNGWFRTGDQGYQDEDGYLFVTGRIKEIINRGGEKIAPREVDEVLLQHPAIAQAVTFAVPDEKLGEEIAAAVTLRPDATADERQIREFASARIAHFKVPRRIILLEEIPKGPTGKLQRIGLAEKLGLAQLQREDERPEFTAPQTPIEKVLCELWRDVLGLAQVGTHDTFLQLGGDSILAALLISRVLDSLKADLSLISVFDDASTIAGMATLIERANGRSDDDNLMRARAPIMPCPRDNPLPLSFGQERLWFLDQLDPGSTVYNRPASIRLHGTLHAEALERSVREIVQRHEVLRTAFPTIDGRASQIVSPSENLSFSIVDLRHLPADRRSEMADREIRKEVQRPFDLSRGPLLRAVLLRVSSEDHVLVVTAHHIVFDYWSMDILMKELSALYDAFSNGNPSPLSSLPVQYADFAHWQREYIAGDQLKKHVEYWVKQLCEAHVTQFPSDQSPACAASHEASTQSLELSPELSAKLKRLSRNENVTPFMTLVAALDLLIYRHTNQDRITIGTPVSGRNRSEVESLIGFFVNTLVLSTDLSGNPTFREHLQRVRRVCLDAYNHQELPFEKLVQELQVQRDLARTPLFDIFINYAPRPARFPATDELTLRVDDVPEFVARFPFSLYVIEEDRGINLRIVYRRAQFSVRWITCVFEQFRYLLEQLVATPNKPIDSYSLVTPESARVLPDPGAPLEEPEQELVQSQIDRWAQHTPQQTAISQGPVSWSYAELKSRTTALGYVLHSKRIARGEVVAICGAKSPGLIAAMVSVLKNGGVLLPIDEQLPDQRKQLMMREACVAKLVYVGSRTRENTWFHELEELDVIFVDALTATIDDVTHPDSHVISLPDISPDDPAYVFFTSGTTGVPKGVLGTHKGLSHFLNWQRETFEITSNDRVAQLTGFSFDVVLRDVFLPLTSGATLCLPEESPDLPPGGVVTWLDREQITVLHTVPSLAQSWLSDAPADTSPGSMRYVFFAGEALTEALVSRWRSRFSNHVRIVNLFGPTETTLAKCFYRVPPEVRPGVQPIGFPLPQTQALILRKREQLCGIGEPGEIVIRTPFRTLGYLNAADEMQSRFVRNPFRNDESDILYFTGDFGRNLPDGALEILGRTDDQTKIRGVRVEPNEVSAHLARHSKVQSCFVRAAKSEDHENYLAAYVVPTIRERPSMDELRAYLGDRLPSAMIPASFILLETLPLTANGKVDRNALPAPHMTRSDVGNAFVPPRTAMERELVEIWSKILRVQRLGVKDSFFDLGGHSLLAVRILNEIWNSIGKELPLSDIFRSPTIEQLAILIEDTSICSDAALVPTSLRESAGRKRTNLSLTMKRSDSVDSASIPRCSSNEPVRLSLSQERLWFQEQLEPGGFAHNVSRAFRLKGTLDLTALEQAFLEVIRRHETLRTTFSSQGGVPVQQKMQSDALNMRLVDLTNLEKAQREPSAVEVAVSDAHRPFSLNEGPPMRVTLVRIKQDEHLLLLTVHHIVFDGWSLPILLREIEVLYKAYCNSRPSPLQDLPIQYADFVLWQRQRLEHGVFDSDLSYWKEQLKDCPRIVELPTDRPRAIIPKRVTFRQSFVLPRSIYKSLKIFSRQMRATIFMTLLAAFQTLLHRYTRQEDIVVGSHVAGRRLVETESIIGLFANAVVLRSDISGDPTFRHLLRRVRDVCLGAYDHQNLSFAKVVEAIEPHRDRRYAPLFQVLFMVQNGAPKLRLTDMVVEPWDFTQQGQSDLDLALVFTEETEFGLNGWFGYSTHLFEQATIDRMIGHFLTMLDGIAADPDQHISHLPMLTLAERTQLLVDWHSTETPDVQVNACVNRQFELQVEKTPDAIALIFDNGEVRYRTLNALANRLARRLLSLDVGPEVRVGICMKRCPETVIAILAVLKAGGSYVPIDPSYPKNRVAFMMSDSQISVLLTQRDLAADLPVAQTVLYIDDVLDEMEVAELEDSNNLAHCASGNDLAYVIYTSGSTGQPNGVMVEHRGVCNLCEAQISAFGIDSSSRVLQFASMSFDAAVSEIFTTFLSGATLCIATESQIRPGPDLISLLRSRHITTVTLPPSVLVVLPPEELPELTTVISAGEACTNDIVRRWALGRRFLNAYGPTEATVCATITDPLSDTSRLSIGKPISNTQIYLLDSKLQPVPIGVPGELHIAGVGLARGYLNRPELTAERFIQNPFSRPDPDARMYKTGDIARYLPDGNIEFLGRNDDQVKVRGFRISLGEVEAALREHPGVQSAAVKVHEYSPGDQRLVAYIVPDAKRAFPIAQLLQLESDGALTGLAQYDLPNGMTIVHHHSGETDFIYKEIFEEQVYTKYGITLGKGGCIFDIGANIGLFSLFASMKNPQTPVYAFEPVPPNFERLRINALLYDADWKLFQCGLADIPGESTFTFFSILPSMWDRFSSARETLVTEGEVRGAVNDYLRKRAGGDGQCNEQFFGDLMSTKASIERFSCPISTISHIIREHGIQEIELLKIDVEKSELDVLCGIQDVDWPRIRQIVMEVHDIQGRVDIVRSLLTQHGYNVQVIQENFFDSEELFEAGIFLIIGIRPSCGTELTDEPDTGWPLPANLTWSSRDLLVNDVRGSLTNALPDHMMPSSYVLLDSMPVLPNGKLDRRSLPAPPDGESQRTHGMVRPRNPVEEELAGIWRELLGRQQISVLDSFFDLGGHSLLLVRLASHISEAFQVQLPLSALFDRPTIDQMSMAILSAQIDDEDLPTVARMLDEVKDLTSDEIKRLMETEEENRNSDTQGFARQ